MHNSVLQRLESLSLLVEYELYFNNFSIRLYLKLIDKTLPLRIKPKRDSVCLL